VFSSPLDVSSAIYHTKSYQNGVALSTEEADEERAGVCFPIEVPTFLTLEKKGKKKAISTHLSDALASSKMLTILVT
jgi:hypothetical protein